MKRINAPLRPMFLCLLVLLGFWPMAFASLSIRRGEVSDVRIVLPDAPTVASTAYAAQELQSHVAALTGVTLPLANNAVGIPAFRLVEASVGGDEDAFRLRSDAGGLTITGGKRGLLYGVYEVLERFGDCGWFSSTTTVIPKLEAFTIPDGLDEMHRPTFRMREAYFSDVRTNGDFAARLRLNCDFPALGEKHGGKRYRVGAGLRSHTFDILVPAAKYDQTHPEYFAERDGKRVVTGRPQIDMQLCLTNPDVLEIATRGILDAIARDPTGDRFGVFQNDNQKPCTCAACAAVDAEEGSPAGSLIRFVNALADRVAAKHPDKFIQTGAYQYTRKPPKTRPRPNVLIELCTIECDFAHPIATGRHPENVAFRRDFEGWSRLTDNLFIWNYATDFSAYTMPFPNLGPLQEDIRYFRDRGVSLMSVEGSYQGAGADLAELKLWLLAKWMWNPDLDAERLTDTFCRGYYGAAAPFARDYLRLLESCATAHPDKRLSCFFDATDRSFVSDGFLAKARALWDQAEQAVANDPQRLVNVRLSAFATDMTRFQRDAGKFVSVPFSVRRTPPTDTQSQRDFRTLARRLHSVIKETPNVRLSEYQEEKERPLLQAIARATEETSAPSFVPCDGVTLEETSLRRMERDGNWCALVADRNASGGKAIRFSNTAYDWCVQLDLPPTAFDADAAYRIRVKAKVVLKSEAKDGDTAFSFGLQDAEAGKSAGTVAFRVKDVTDGIWRWYEGVTYRPVGNQRLWIASGFFDKKRFKTHPSVEALFVDQVEIRRLGSDQPPVTPVFDVKDFGAVGDGKAKDTAAIQRAVDAAAKAGGGRVLLPAGRYLSGTVYLKDNIDFHLAADAELFGSPDPTDYNPPDVCPQNRASKMENTSGAHLLMATERKNVSLSGAGTINGNFAAFLVDPKTGDNYPGRWKGITWRPAQMIAFFECENVSVRDLHLTGAAYWSCFFHGCRGVRAERLDVTTSRKPRAWNGDGLDVDCCQDILIADCRIVTDDDCITFRTNGEPLRHPMDCAYAVISNCYLSSLCNAVRLGVGQGRIHDAVFTDLTIRETRTAVNIVGGYCAGADAHSTDVLFRNLDVACENFCRIHHMRSEQAEIGDIRFENVRGRQSSRSYIWAKASRPFGRLSFSHVDLVGEGVEIDHADVTFDDCKLKRLPSTDPAKRPVLY